MTLLGEFLIANPVFTQIGSGFLLVVGSYLIYRRLIELERSDKEYERRIKREYRIDKEETERRYL